MTLTDAHKVMDRLFSMLLDSGRAASADVSGLTEQEITTVEADQGVKLPPIYRAFLAIMGKSAGSLFVGSDAFFPQILGLRCDAEELLEENSSPFTLDSTDVVFLMHQGYQFMFMHGSDDDPPVFLYKEGDDRPSLVASRLSSFLEGAIKDRQTKNNH